VDLAHYLLEAQEMINIVLGKRIVLSLSVEPALPAEKVDTSELELALINLALNARDALPRGGQVGVHARRAEPSESVTLAAPGRYVAIAFGDTGEGIDSDVIEHVFEPFFTTKAAGKGTGLGLSQVHGFCAQAGGTALVSSTPGMGTTVLLVLPAADAAAPGAADTESAAAPIDTSGLVGKRLLLVEDNAELGDSTAALLESFGFQVERAANAEQALARVRATTPRHDIVLSDVLMPGDMDGLAMARALRELEPQLPVVLISGYSSALTQARDFVVLHKPCAPGELLDTLRRAIEQGA
jgi:CheY-like chemotaxis protein